MPLWQGCFLFHFCICFSLGFTVSVHGDFVCCLPELCGIHPTDAFQLSELSLDVCTGLSHKGSIHHPLILGCLRVTCGVCLNASHGLS